MSYLILIYCLAIALSSIVFSISHMMYKTDAEYLVIEDKIYNDTLVKHFLQTYNESVINSLLLCHVMGIGLYFGKYELTVYNDKRGKFVTLYLNRLFCLILLDVDNGFYHLYSKDKFLKSGLLSLTSMDLLNKIVDKG